MIIKVAILYYLLTTLPHVKQRVLLVMDFESFGITREMLKEFEYIDECIYSTDLDEEVLEELEGCQCIQSCSQDQNCRCLSFCQAYTLEGLLQPGSDRLLIFSTLKYSYFSVEF